MPRNNPEIIELEMEVDIQDSASAKNAEAWAVGKRNGVDVPATDETYHNNAKYYAGQASENGEAWAVGQRGGVDVPDTDPAYQNNAKYYAGRCVNAEQAAVAAEAAQAAAAIAQGKAETAQTAAEVAQDLAEDAVADTGTNATRAEAARDEAVAAAETFTSGLTFKGSVNYASGLPGSDNTLGDEYLVLYSGSSGTNYIGQKYAWDGTAWQPVGTNTKLYRDADGDLCEED